METNPLPEARVRVSRRWLLDDAGFLKRLGAAFMLFGDSLLATIPFELTRASEGCTRSLYWASSIVGMASFFLAVIAAMLACGRALRPRFGELKPLRSTRDRFIMLLCGIACYGIAFTALILIARSSMAWRGTAGFLALSGGAYLLVRARRPVR